VFIFIFFQLQVQSDIQSDMTVSCICEN